MWQWVAIGNIQQISYIPQMEQHSPFWLILGNVCTYIHVMYTCVHEQSVNHILDMPRCYKELAMYIQKYTYTHITI